MKSLFSELLADRWRNLQRKIWSDQTGLDLSRLSDDACDKIAAELADPERDEV